MCYTVSEGGGQWYDWQGLEVNKTCRRHGRLDPPDKLVAGLMDVSPADIEKVTL